MMKNITAFAFSIIAIFAISCSSLQKTDVHSKEEVMKMDALALSDIECKSEYLQLLSADSVLDRRQQNRFRELKETNDELSVILFHKYYNNSTTKAKFEELKKSLQTDLSSCMKLEEYKIMQEALKDNDSIPQNN